MCMRVARISLIALLSPFAASAQTPVDWKSTETVDRVFSSTTSTDPVLKCQVTPIKPALDFSLRVQAGYALKVPLYQFPETGHGIDVFLRVRSDAEEVSALYFHDHYDLSPALDPTFEGEIEGRFVAPPGKYTVALAAKDDAGRRCRDDWHVEIRPEPVRPGPSNARPLGRLTVLLDAAPLDRGSSKPRASDVSILTSTLESVMEQLPARSVRLVVFNMESFFWVHWRGWTRRFQSLRLSVGERVQSFFIFSVGLVAWMDLQSRVGGKNTHAGEGHVPRFRGLPLSPRSGTPSLVQSEW
jgi:hypothetical protein